MLGTLTNLMHCARGFRLTRFATVLLFSLVGLLATTPAFAMGRVVWKSTTIQEHTKKEAWYLELEIYLPKPPDVGQKSMRFEFTQIEEFERSLVDGKEEPQPRNYPLSNQQALIESQLVGFMDPGTGKIQDRTRFSFKVTRAHGYRAGKYKVKIKDSDTGNMIGNETTLTFKGENPIVDRRSIVFQGSEKKKPDSSSEGSSTGKTITDLNAPDEPEPTPMPQGDYEPSEPVDSGDTPPSVDERPGGGCHYGGHDAGGWALGLVLGSLFGLLLTRRRFG